MGSFNFFRTPFVVIFTFGIFGLQCYYLTKNAGGAPIIIFFFLENVNCDELIVLSVKNASDRVLRPCVFKKVVQSGTP